VGGFTFQELNLTIDDIKMTSEAGTDLSYDFINRPAYQHALAMADTEFLRLTLNASLALGVNPVQLVHALQNHDELTYELVHFTTAHKDDHYHYHGEEITGGDLAKTIRQDLIDRLTGEAAPYNLIFTTNGIASTTGTVIAAALGYTRIDNLSDEQIPQDQAGTSAVGHVQLTSTRGVLHLGVGSARHADRRPRRDRATP